MANICRKRKKRRQENAVLGCKPATIRRRKNARKWGNVVAKSEPDRSRDHHQTWVDNKNTNKQPKKSADMSTESMTLD